MEYLEYCNASFLAKDLYEITQVENVGIVNGANDALIDLRNDINKNKIPKFENPDKLTDIIDKLLTLINNKKDSKY